MLMVKSSIPRPQLVPLFNTYTAKPVCWNGWISDSYCSLKPLCSGMGEVVPARTSPTLLPPSPRTVLSLSCFKVPQCINCRDWCSMCLLPEHSFMYFGCQVPSQDCVHIRSIVLHNKATFTNPAT